VTPPSSAGRAAKGCIDLAGGPNSFRWSASGKPIFVEIRRPVAEMTGLASHPCLSRRGRTISGLDPARVLDPGARPHSSALCRYARRRRFGPARNRIPLDLEPYAEPEAPNFPIVDLFCATVAALEMKRPHAPRSRNIHRTLTQAHARCPGQDPKGDGIGDDDEWASPSFSGSPMPPPR